MGKVKEIKLVLDTNAIVSAILFGDVPGRLIPLWKNGRIKPEASKEIIDEYIKVLTYPKFELSEAEINYILYGEILPYFDISRSQKGLPSLRPIRPAISSFTVQQPERPVC